MRSLLNDNNFTWFLGVVEDRGDPVQLGRVRVRCYGFHTEDKDQIPTSQLPWAVPIQGITSAALNGMGHSPTGLVEGSWVVGFFLDGDRAQEPVIVGSIGSIPSNHGDPKKGFNDPRIRDEDDDLHPHSIYPRYINESDVNRLARHTVIHSDKKTRITTSNPVEHAAKDAAAYTSIPVATPDEGEVNTSPFWNEPKSTDINSSGKPRYQARYPHNHVYESESGHVREYDDTAGVERIHEYHRKGTFYEIDADGNKHTRVVANNYTVVLVLTTFMLMVMLILPLKVIAKHLSKGIGKLRLKGIKQNIFMGLIHKL